MFCVLPMKCIDVFPPPLFDVEATVRDTGKVTGYETAVFASRRSCLSPRRRRTRGLLHSPHAATACSTVTTCRETVRNKAVFRTVSTQTRTGISTSFLTWETRLDHDLHQGTTHDLPQQGHRPASTSTATVGSRLFSRRSSTVG